jgi:hypothetical protein
MDYWCQTILTSVIEAMKTSRTFSTELQVTLMNLASAPYIAWKWFVCHLFLRTLCFGIEVSRNVKPVSDMWYSAGNLRDFCLCIVPFFSLFFSWGGVRLRQLGTLATIRPIVPALDDRWWMWSSRWNENWQGKPKYLEKTCPNASLSTKNPAWPDLGSDPGPRGGKQVTNHLSYSMAVALFLSLCFCVDIL